MAIPINSINRLQDYLNGVIDRTHHAPNVNGVAFALIGAVIWRAQGQIDVRERNGSSANMLWFTVNGDRYAMVYNHKSQRIEMRGRTLRGRVLHSFDNLTTYQYIIDAFAAL